MATITLIAATALAILLGAVPCAVAEGRGEGPAYHLGHRAGQITPDLLVAALVPGVMPGGALRRRSAG